MSGAARSRAVFPEIQALRVVAVLGVVVYHLWPNRLPGGYVGVDVFFVISGFLITSHLVREWDRSGTIRLGAFYARRARRLLPASLLVLAVTAVATWAVLPERLWNQVFSEVIGAGLYVENWVLASDSVDYLAQNVNIASPVQHFWSLSTEEQFYLVWPLLMIVAGTIWVRSRRRSGAGARPEGAGARPALVVALALVFVVSLALSIVLTIRDPGPAYFATWTRAWEFAAGGLLALVLRRSEGRSAVRAAASWIGFAAIAVVMLTFTPATPFPGWWALLPVLATVVVIAAGDPTDRWAPGFVTRLRPVQWTGDVSYSIYLWHWPMIVFAPYVLGHPNGFRVKAAIVVAAFVVAGLSKRFVEDPVRRAPFLAGRRARFTAIAVVAALVPLVAFSGGLSAVATTHIRAEQQLAAQLLDGNAPCLGAGFLMHADCATAKQPSVLLPGVDSASTDDVNTPDCWSRSGDDTLRVCSHGPSSGAALRVALVGDSHSNQYLATMEALADRYHWRVDVYGKSGCVWSAAEQQDTPDWLANCDSWRAKVNARLASVAPYDVVVTSYQASSPFAKPSSGTTDQAVVAGFEKVWSPVAARGTKIVAIRDNPHPRADYLQCVAAHASDPGPACAVPERQAYPFFDGQATAAAHVPGASVLDLGSLFCQDAICPPVIGDVIVYRDGTHLTSTYTRTLAPAVRQGVLSLTGLHER